MDKLEIKALILTNHQAFLSKLDELSDIDFMKSTNGKWTAGQQLEHILKSTKPVARAFEIPKSVLKDKFGLASKPSRDYKKIVADYLETLRQNPDYKLEERFSPEEVDLEQKNEKLKALKEVIEKLTVGIENFTEPELDIYILPHPVMGKFTLREVLYFVAYHVTHHDKQILQNLRHEN
ncbi:DinB family protein [Croceitalea rosinachiae]|uniref:DinB family protein n=1 Tax=Croceitalea rosinachiae TaxID=3075596 RepID=A0ABU3ADW0_9FLAO|nr:DinB family protein [Croceitalea sp. F388]MDT0608085.1 DinB family protein [Croceitalea sp. F388]